MPSLSDQVLEAHRRWPRPTNAEALALLDAYGQLPLDESALDDQLDLVRRLRWLAVGYGGPGDKMKTATNATWYTRTPFGAASTLWGVLDEEARLSDEYLQHVAPDQYGVLLPVVDAKIAAGDVAQELALAWREVRDAREAGEDVRVTFGPPLGVVKEALRRIREEARRRVPDVVDVIKAPNRAAMSIFLILIAALLIRGTNR